MDILEHTKQLRHRLNTSGLMLKTVSEASGAQGLSESWLSKFGRGIMDNPSVQTLALLEQTLDALEDKAA